LVTTQNNLAKLVKEIMDSLESQDSSQDLKQDLRQDFVDIQTSSYSMG
jgi:hypothetical protein